MKLSKFKQLRRDTHWSEDAVYCCSDELCGWVGTGPDLVSDSGFDSWWMQPTCPLCGEDAYEEGI